MSHLKRYLSYNVDFLCFPLDSTGTRLDITGRHQYVWQYATISVGHSQAKSSLSFGEWHTPSWQSAES